MTEQEISLLVEISEKVGELTGAVKGLTDVNQLLVARIETLEKVVTEHSETFASQKDLDKLAEKLREVLADVKALKEKPANDALKAAQKIKGVLWTIAGSVGGVGVLAGIIYVYQALEAAHKLTGGLNG